MKNNQETIRTMVLKSGEKIMINEFPITPETIDYLKGWCEFPMVLETGKTILINGVEITPEFLNFIKSWREEDNAIILEIQNDIADVTSSILLAMDYVYEDYMQDMLINIKELNRTRKNLKYLMSPEK